jgi:hypothetical protein
MEMYFSFSVMDGDFIVLEGMCPLESNHEISDWCYLCLTDHLFKSIFIIFRMYKGKNWNLDIYCFLQVFVKWCLVLETVPLTLICPCSIRLYGIVRTVVLYHYTTGRYPGRIWWWWWWRLLRILICGTETYKRSRFIKDISLILI